MLFLLMCIEVLNKAEFIMVIYEEVLRLSKEGTPCALATIVQCIGSAPQKEGAKLLVREDGSTVGTLGGGCLEAEVVQAALMALKDETARTIPFELTERQGGLVCGGKVLVFVEPHIPEPHLVILGAGHVGKALSKAAGFVGLEVTVVDDRAEYANRDNIVDAETFIVSDFQDVFSHMPVSENTYVVIATRGHLHDYEALKCSLGTRAGYIGLLGSRRKKALLHKKLQSEGYSSEDIERIITPVGLPIGAVTPEEIAISIVAQIIETRRKGAPACIGDSSCGGELEKDGQEQTAPSHL